MTHFYVVPVCHTYNVPVHVSSCHVRAGKIQISLRKSTNRSEAEFSTWRNIEPLATHRALIEDSDQTARTRRLIWVFD